MWNGKKKINWWTIQQLKDQSVIWVTEVGDSCFKCQHPWWYGGTFVRIVMCCMYLVLRFSVSSLIVSCCIFLGFSLVSVVSVQSYLCLIHSIQYSRCLCFYLASALLYSDPWVVTCFTFPASLFLTVITLLCFTCCMPNYLPPPSVLTSLCSHLSLSDHCVLSGPSFRCSSWVITVFLVFSVC